MFLGLFAAGFFIAYANGGILPDAISDLITLGVTIYLWWLGYQRFQDAGISRIWALFTPIMLGAIILGCIRSSVVSVRSEMTEMK